MWRLYLLKKYFNTLLLPMLELIVRQKYYNYEVGHIFNLIRVTIKWFVKMPNHVSLSSSQLFTIIPTKQFRYYVSFIATATWNRTSDKTASTNKMRISKNLESMNYIKSSENNDSDYIRFRQEMQKSTEDHSGNRISLI